MGSIFAIGSVIGIYLLAFYFGFGVLESGPNINSTYPKDLLTKKYSLNLNTCLQTTNSVWRYTFIQHIPLMHFYGACLNNEGPHLSDVVIMLILFSLRFLGHFRSCDMLQQNGWKQKQKMSNAIHENSETPDLISFLASSGLKLIQTRTIITVIKTLCF